LQKAAALRFDALISSEAEQTEDVSKMLAKDAETDTRLEGFEPTTPGSEDED